VPTVAFLNNALQVLLAADPDAEADKQTGDDDGGAIVQAEADQPSDQREEARD